MTENNKSERFEEWEEKFWQENRRYCNRDDIWNHQQKKIDKLEEQLRGERQATKTFSEHLNNERVRHGSTEKKLQAAEEREMILDSLIREIVTSVKSNHSFHGGGWGIDCGDEDCLGCYWQRQALEKVRKE